MKLEMIELLFLRRVVEDNIGALQRRLDKYHRYSGGDHADTFVKKIALAEAELSVMYSLKDKLNYDIALVDMLE